MSLDATYTREIPLVEGRTSFKEIDDVIAKPTETKPSIKWFIAIGISSTALLIGAVCLGLTFWYGVGLWGNNQPVGWAFDIINFVFWIGIGHAGTLISAILFLFRQKWRTGIARFAEGMTIFAVMTAGIFPAIHTGVRGLMAILFLIQTSTVYGLTLHLLCYGMCLQYQHISLYHLFSGT